MNNIDRHGNVHSTPLHVKTYDEVVVETLNGNREQPKLDPIDDPHHPLYDGVTLPKLEDTLKKDDFFEEDQAPTRFSLSIWFENTDETFEGMHALGEQIAKLVPGISFEVRED